MESMEGTVEWVSDEEATQLSLKGIGTVSETCSFCGKSFASHNSFTAHLRWHSEEIDNMMYDIINRSSKPVRLATIQKLANVNFSVNNSVQRLVRDGRVRRSGFKFSAKMRGGKRAAAPSPSPSIMVPAPEAPVKITSAISDEQMNKLIVLTLKRTKPEVYNSVVNEIIENMVRYAVGIAELS